MIYPRGADELTEQSTSTKAYYILVLVQRNFSPPGMHWNDNNKYMSGRDRL